MTKCMEWREETAAWPSDRGAVMPILMGGWAGAGPGASRSSQSTKGNIGGTGRSSAIGEGDGRWGGEGNGGSGLAARNTSGNNSAGFGSRRSGIV